MYEDDEILQRLDELHARVDQAAAAVGSQHGARLVCKLGCIGCCADELTVFEVEAERIRRAYPSLLENGAPHAAGRCAFLSEEGACRVYEARPYVCRTQGLPLRWIDEELQAELRDICELNDGDPPIETLPAEACWTIGPVEDELADLQRAWGQQMTRVPLRELFRRRSNLTPTRLEKP